MLLKLFILYVQICFDPNTKMQLVTVLLLSIGVSDLTFCVYPVQENKVMFFEVSAYTGKNVTESLTHLAR